MVADYWPNISNNSYGLIRYVNNSNSWISTYLKISDIAGEITINGISAGYRPQRGILVSGAWTWDNYILNSDLMIFGGAKSVAIATETNIVHMYFYTDDAKRNGYRIDANGTTKRLSLLRIANGTSAEICGIGMS